MATTTLTIRIPEDEKRLISDYARAHGMSVSEFARKTIMESIEEQIDTRYLLKAVENDDGSRYSMDSVMKEVL